ncbi:MAG: glycosyltransferase [Malacoplasma sp.]
MKLLIIMHSTNTLYGAGKSLLGWLNKVNCPYDLLYPKTIFNYNENKFQNKFNDYCKNKFSAWIPLYHNIKGRESASIKGKMYWVFNNIMYKLNKRKISKIIDKGNYDAIYLNSLVLYPLVSEKNNFILHVREIFDGNQKVLAKITRKLEKCAGVIFIDYATATPFKDVICKKTILNNPFNMLSVDTINSKDVLKKLKLDSDKSICAIIGVISSDKGIERVLEAFRISRIESYLLVVGDCNRKYAQKLKKNYGNLQNIIFTGEIENINEIYSIADVIIRGEEQFCIGRTIFEGLYSGCHVLIPGELTDIENIVENEKFINKIHFYKPGNIQDMASALKKLENRKIEKRKFMSNDIKYTNDIIRFIKNSISKV